MVLHKIAVLTALVNGIPEPIHDIPITYGANDFSSRWCRLSSTCCSGASQSPIDIPISAVTQNHMYNMETTTLPTTKKTYFPFLVAEAFENGNAKSNLVLEKNKSNALNKANDLVLKWIENPHFPFMFGAENPLTFSGGYSNDQTGTISNKEGKAVQFDIPSRTADQLILSGGILGLSQYKLLQFHFHTPSEHSVGGQRFAGEIHLVHQNILDENDITVIGFFMHNTIKNKQSPSLWIQNILDKIGSLLTEPDAKIENFQLNLAQLFVEAPSLTDYVFYQGSLTTPPCSEKVNWILMLKPIEIASDQMNLFRNIKDKGNSFLVKNNRPIQPLNGRKVWRSRERISY